MLELLSKRFIKNYSDYQNTKVRGHYGMLVSIVSILLNAVMAGFKIALGFMTGSSAILADGFNNLSDVASNVASLFGFVMALKNPDKEHPFGHGRMEYLASLAIALLIFFVGTQTLWNSVFHIISPVAVEFTFMTVIVLISSIVIKLWMGRFNLAVGKKIDSQALTAASKDSLSDVLATVATLIAIILSQYTTLPVDGLLGVVVSVIILKTGIDIYRDTMASILGKAPDEELLTKLRRFVATYDHIIGSHDLMIHDYGPGRRYLTIHVEVNKNEELMVIHEVIDQIERDIYNDFKIKATIHLDPVDLTDELTRKMKLVVSDVLWKINSQYSLHDFRIKKNDSEVTLIFDVQIPADDLTPHHDLMRQIDGLINEAGHKYKTLIQIDHSYT